MTLAAGLKRWLAFVCVAAFAFPASALSDTEALVAQGIAHRQQGNLQQAIDLLSLAGAAAATPAAKARAAGELGISLLQAYRFVAAEAALRQAHDFFTGPEGARYAVYLGNLALLQKQPEQARRFYQEAADSDGNDPETKLSAGLNLARLAAGKEKLEQLQSLSRTLDQARDDAALARHHLNLGNQARALGNQALRLAHRHIDKARQLADLSGDLRLHIEALDALAQLYEEQGRKDEALTLSRQAIDLARPLNPGQSADLLISLEWRQGRLQQQRGEIVAALAAYRRAVDQIEAVRQDIPVEYDDGQSSFRATLEPIYLGYADLMLQQLDKQAPALQQESLRRVVGALELIRQTELQDFLGDRCATEAVQGGSAGQTPPGTAVLYPLILPDRVELLLVGSRDIVRRTTVVKEDHLKRTALAFAASLRHGLPDFSGPARQLHAWLLAPIEGALDEQRITNLVVVPDGVIRLVPIGALHDGKRYAIEKYAVSMVTGMTMTNASLPPASSVLALVAGLSEPGPVVEKLGVLMSNKVLQPNAAASDASVRGLAARRELRAIRTLDGKPAAANAPKTHAQQMDELREKLALPGVKDEVKGLSSILPGANIIDADFTLGRFQTEAGAGEYRILHIASHGIFGGNAETSFIMAYDDVLNMNGLQSLLKSERFQKTPIELLSLSACQTAEGNDRAPLGISGAAIKARAKSVLGTLWPVDDNAAKTIMETLYGGLTKDKLGKAEALRQAQIKLIRDPESDHPFYWAPFVLIGNWL